MERKRYRQSGNDLYFDFPCTCPDPSFADSTVSHLMNNRVKLVGYDDDNFFDVVNSKPWRGTCRCGRRYTYQWFRDGVEYSWDDQKPDSTPSDIPEKPSNVSENTSGAERGRSKHSEWLSIPLDAYSTISEAVLELCGFTFVPALAGTMPYWSRDYDEALQVHVVDTNDRALTGLWSVRVTRNDIPVVLRSIRTVLELSRVVSLFWESTFVDLEDDMEDFVNHLDGLPCPLCGARPYEDYSTLSTQELMLPGPVRLYQCACVTCQKTMNFCKTDSGFSLVPQAVLESPPTA